jgi:hypothetical protein
MSGKVPPSSRSRQRLSGRSDVAKAAAMYEKFTGHDAKSLGTIAMPRMPKAVAVIGECDGVLYTTVRDGKLERYIHEFADKDKPLLCVTPSGDQLMLIGGRYVFTDRGIVDLSDTANLPASLKRSLAKRRLV